MQYRMILTLLKIQGRMNPINFVWWKDAAKSKTAVTQVKEPVANDQSPEQSKTQRRDYPKYHSWTRERYPYDTSRNAGYKDQQMQDSKEIQQDNSGNRSPRANKHQLSDRKPDDSKGPTCYQCSRVGHYSYDLKCPDSEQSKPGVRVHTVWEHLSTEMAEEAGPSSKAGSMDHATWQERCAAAYRDSDGYRQSDRASEWLMSVPYGSQYSLEGELHTYDSDKDLLTSGCSTSECCNAMQDGYSEYKSDDCLSMWMASEEEEEDDYPSVQSVLDSNSKEDNEEELMLLLSEHSGVIKDTPNFVTYQGPLALMKSPRKITCPPWTEKDNRCFMARMNINNLEAVVLLGSACTSDSISPEFMTSANLKVHKLEEQVPLQLGMVGSHSKISFGLFTNFKIGEISGKHYFDVVNIDRYNAILGTVFMRKYGVVLDFEHDEVHIKGKCLDTVIEKERMIHQACWYAMCLPRLGDNWLESRPSTTKLRRKKALTSRNLAPWRTNLHQWNTNQFRWKK
jgi:hypothetical protein